MYNTLRLSFTLKPPRTLLIRNKMNIATIYNMGSNNPDSLEISAGASHQNPAGITDTGLYEVIVTTKELQHCKMENVNVYENFAEEHKYVRCLRDNLDNSLKAITEKCNVVSEVHRSEYESESLQDETGQCSSETTSEQPLVTSCIRKINNRIICISSAAVVAFLLVSSVSGYLCFWVGRQGDDISIGNNYNQSSNIKNDEYTTSQIPKGRDEPKIIYTTKVLASKNTRSSSLPTTNANFTNQDTHVEETTSCMSESTFPPVRYLYRDVSNFSYSIQLCVFNNKKASNLKDMVFVNNYIWLLHSPNIAIFNKDNCKLVWFQRGAKKIFKYSKSLVYSTSGYVLVISPHTEEVKGGIDMFNYNGRYVKRLTNTAYDGVCIHKNRLYALDTNTLHTALIIENNIWHETGSVGMDLDGFSERSRSKAVYCNKHGLFIVYRSWVYHVSHAGKLLQRHALPGDFNSVSSFGVDEVGNVMVADNNSSRIQLFNSCTKKWERLNFIIKNIGTSAFVINAEGKEIIPENILFDGNSGNMWIASQSKTKSNTLKLMVTKYTKI